MKYVVGGEFSTPFLPTVQAIIEDKHQMIESGELLSWEPCTLYTVTKSTVTSTGDINFESIQIYGWKIPLLYLTKLLTKYEKYMRINLPQESTGIKEPYTRHLALWHDHSTILHMGYVMFSRAEPVWHQDTNIFMTEEECASLLGQQISNLYDYS